MGCASSKPSSSSTTTSKSHKKKDKTSPAKSDQIAPSNDGANSKKASSLKTNGTTPQQPGEITTNGSLNESKSPLHLKQQAQAERARRLAHHLHIDESLLHEIDQQRNRVITYLVTSVRRDLNSELIGAHSGSKNLADLVMAAAAATDNDDLITDVVSRAVLLILNGTAGHSYKDLSDQLKSHQYLCKHQQHKQRICEITVDTIYGAIEGGGGQTLAEFLTGESTTQQQQQQHQVNRTPQMGDSNGQQQEAVLLSRSQAKEVARILFLTDRARPVVHASPNSAHKDAYFVNKQLSDMSEVSVSKTEIDEILRAFERPEPIEIAALSAAAPRSKNLIEDFNSITLEPVQPPPPQTVTRIVIDGEETIPTDVTIQYEDQPTTQQSDKVDESNSNPNAAQEALDTLVAISALATKLNNERLSNNGEQEVVVVDEKPIVEADSNNNNLVVVSESIVVVDTSSENINNNINSSISSSSAHVEHNEDANTQENGELDPTLKQSLLDDRFYNNDAFKTEPPVNGENLDEAATVIQASFKGHQERKETDETNEVEVEATAETTATNLVVINEPQELERSESNDNDQPQETPLTPKPSLQEINQLEVQQEVPQEAPQEAQQEAPQEVQQETQQETPQEVPHHHHEIHNEAEAATMIQATFRGYKARKELKEGSTKSPESTPHLSPEPPKQEDNSSSAQEAESTPSGQQQTELSTSKSTNDLDHAATKIQATFRGFRARKEFTARKDEGSKQQAPEQSSDTNAKIKINNTSPETTSNSATLEKKKKKRNKKKRKQQVKA